MLLPTITMQSFIWETTVTHLWCIFWHTANGVFTLLTLTHCTFSWEGQRLRQRGHRAFSGQQVGISTAGTSSTSTWDSDVSTATRIPEPKLSSIVTLPMKEQQEKIIKIKRSFSTSQAKGCLGPCSSVGLFEHFLSNAISRTQGKTYYLNLPISPGEQEQEDEGMMEFSALHSVTMLYFLLWVLLNPRTSFLKIQINNWCNLTFLIVQYKEITAD